MEIPRKMEKSRIRAVIADDEPLARMRIRELLQQEPDVTVVAECSNGDATVEAIRTKTPEIVFLDVDMPQLSGFEVVEAARAAGVTPAIIFITAHGEFALRAFASHPADYLTKPVCEDRFLQAIRHARDQIHASDRSILSRRVDMLLTDLREQPTTPMDRLLVPVGRRLVFVDPADVRYIAAESNYVRLHLSTTSYVMRETLGRLESRLDPTMFLRIHRSTIVNRHHVREMESLTRESFSLLLDDGSRVSSGTTYRDRLRNWIDCLM